MRRDETNPVEDYAELDVPEVGDFASFEREPEGGDPEAREPEVDRLDLQADDVELDVELTDDDEPEDVARPEALE